MANTNIGGVFSISTTPVESADLPLDESGFASLNYTPVPNMGSHGDTGVEQNIVSYPTWDNLLTVQQKGSATGAQYEVRFLDEPSPGMTAMLSASAIDNGNQYAFKIEWPDGRIEYNAGIVTAPSFPKGENEAFAEAVFTIAANQEIVKSTTPE